MTEQNIFPLFVAGSLLLTLFAFFLVAYLFIQKRKHSEYQLEKQKMIFNHQNNILQVKIEEQENTMDQISKELHDNIKSLLGFTQMNMYMIANLAGIDIPKQIILIEETNKVVGNVIDDIHNISHSLNSNFVRNIGLRETLTRDIENIRLSKNIKIELQIEGSLYSLSPEKELHIYRIAQESIQNCIRHANASYLIIMLQYAPEVFIMKIIDNGIGFDKNKVVEMKGLGFLNMFQRARYIQGKLDVQTAPLKGSTVVLTLNITKYGNAY